MITFISMMMTCDCTCKSSVGFTFSSLLMGVFICAVSHIILKIIILLLRGMLIRDCDWESCNNEKEIVNVEARCVKVAQNGFGEIVHYIDYDEGVLQKGVEEISQLEDGSVRGFNGFSEVLQFDDQCREGFKQNPVEEILQFDDQCAGCFIKNAVDYDEGVLQMGVEEISQLEDESVRGYNGFAEILWFDDQCPESFKQNQVEKILQFDDQCAGCFIKNGVEQISLSNDQCDGGFIKNGVDEILLSNDQCDGGFIKNGVEETSLSTEKYDGAYKQDGVEKIPQFNDHCFGDFKQDGFGKILQVDDHRVGGFEHNGIEENLQPDDQCVGGFEQRFEKIMQLDDQCVLRFSFKHNGYEKFLQLDDHCAGGFQQNGFEKILQLDDRYAGAFERNDDQCVGGFKQNEFEKILQLHDQCVGGFKQNDDQCVGAFEHNDDQCVGGFKQNGFEKKLQYDDQCIGGFKQNGFEKILQLDDHCARAFEHNDDQCVGGSRENGFDKILELDDQCVGGFSQDGGEENVTHLENHDEDQHTSQLKEDKCAEDQELIVPDNSEADGEEGSEELVSCVGQNALITSGTSTAKEEQLEVNGFCFGTDHNVEDSLDSPKYEEKGLESPTSKDIVGQIEEIAAVEDMAVVTSDTVAREHLNTEFEEKNLSEASIEHLNTEFEEKNLSEASIGHNNLNEVLDINAVEGSSTIGEICEIEEKKNALDKMLEELESKELEELCTVPNNDRQIYELMHDLSKDEDGENQVCEIVEDDISDFSTERKNPDHFKVADRIRDLKHDLLRLQYEFVSEESTSKSSGSEQRNSTMSRQSELEDCWYNQPAPPSPGHGSNTANTATSIDALYETYTERMRHFDRINNYQMHSVGIFEPKFLQKSRSLKLTSSFRQLSSRRREVENDEIDYKLQKEELETVYVAQTCLTWEALHWQYKIVRYLEASSSIDGEASLSYEQAAEQFKQFQVLLQRFLENEHFNQGARIQEYSRSRSLMPKLLQVPALRASSTEGTEEEIHEAFYRDPVTISELIKIMEEAIMTFWDFVKADKDIKTCKSKKHQKLMDSADSTLLQAIRRCLEKKESRLNDLKRRGKFLRKNKSNPRRAEETEILLALIDLRIITRVLSMSRMTKDHLRWCEEKLNALNVSQSNLQRDCMPVYFPS
ncbi:uncharacterized protein LOC131047428 [Cryptomeria japonica]|uniref:uncharacterized protein LOC131047428 n=1 Tax=Cryptomeria japonica TaxID=3369 RepID=UPI0027DA6D06|nr:uncharacterized protein LOC131047428 [Cryptomeria japonica]